VAYYQSGNHLTHYRADIFDKDWQPGEVSIFHGIYRCTGCGIEAAVNERMPHQNHHQHTPRQGLVVWRLSVWVSNNPA